MKYRLLQNNKHVLIQEKWGPIWITATSYCHNLSKLYFNLFGHIMGAKREFVSVNTAKEILKKHKESLNKKKKELTKYRVIALPEETSLYKEINNV